MNEKIDCSMTMIYNKPETWTKSFIDWHINFIKQSCDVELHLKQGCIHCEGMIP